MVERVHVLRQPIVIGAHDQVEAILLRLAVTEGDHLAELISGIHMQDRERQLRRPKGLARQMQQDGRVLADGVEQHRLAELRCGLAEDVDGLRFEQLQV